jgi:uncharacterized protein (DUF3084 family)
MKQVEARKQSGAAKSDREAGNQIAEETGKKPETVRKQIQRAKKEKVGTLLLIPTLVWLSFSDYYGPSCVFSD